ncbi:MAG: zinc metallopeptidase [Bacillota bacterium]|nr:zinc metallopeptidase [Bacillota bacterium]MDD3298874.1 zinc metallopeptidase [Bacillota bacterium]MDD3850963.1 zinc metallopeptidase [Bacillota bacterium]
MFFYYDPTFILLIPAILFSLYAQTKISGTFQRYSRVASRNGYTASDVARRVLDMNGLNNVRIERVRGNLTDHYDPRHKVLRLSDTVHSSTSIAAVGVAAHEAGHAVQHSTGYVPLFMRNTIAPVASFGSSMSWVLIMAGLLMRWFELIQIGIIFFTAVVLFQLITLPVEFNASKRAIAMLTDSGIITSEEITPAKKVLNAAALTYVAAALTAVMQLLRFVLLSNRRR